MFICQGQISKKELELIRKEKKNYEHLAFEAQLYSGRGPLKNKDFRNSLVYFLKVKDQPYTYNIMQSLVLENYNHFEITLTEIASIQYAKYHKSGKFAWHRDDIVMSGSSSWDLIRMLTLSINISDEQEYDGGELTVQHNGGLIKLNKTPGSYIIFPAWLPHQASEVTKGTREAIVSWTLAPPMEQKGFKQKYYEQYPVSK